MKPYFQRNGIAIYHADSSEVDLQGDLLLGDPPYGISHTFGHDTGHKTATGWQKRARRAQSLKVSTGENVPFDPAPWLRFRRVALFGANYFSSRLPDSKCLIIWDKKLGSPDLAADCEIAWTNFPRPSRIFRHLWRGIIRSGEENINRGAKFHQFQKPVALLRNIIEYSGTEGPVVDPWTGSGSTLLAAFDLGLEAVGVDIDEECCEIAANRLESRPEQLRLDDPGSAEAAQLALEMP